MDGPALRTLDGGEGAPRGRIGAVSDLEFGWPGAASGQTFRQRRSGYLALVVMVGLIGGLGLSSLAAARRTESSISALLAANKSSDLQVSTYGGGRVAPVPGTRRR